MMRSDVYLILGAIILFAVVDFWLSGKPDED